MKSDMYFWRCMCANENPLDIVYCNKCRKQRWKQLGITSYDAREIVHSLIPWHRRLKPSPGKEQA
jgi:hypothetical protein